MVRSGDLTHLLLPGHPPPDPASRRAAAHAEAFRLWLAVWNETLRELDGTERVFSDDFCRQDRISALFQGNRCVALGLLRSVDFRLPPARLDSYFKVWPDEAIRRLTEAGPRILVGSHITVDPEFRGTLGDGCRLKNLLVGLMARAFLELGQDAMAGTMRRDRGMHGSAYAFGATPLQAGIIHHGVEVELIAFYRRQLTGASAAVRKDLNVESLWARRLDLTVDAADDQAGEARSVAGGRRMAGTGGGR